MGIKGYREGSRQAERRTPGASGAGGEFTAYTDWHSSLYRTAMADLRRRGDPRYRCHISGDLLESPVRRWSLVATYITFGLSVCLFYDLNFVYVFLAATNIILFATRLVRYWQLDRSSWVVWFAVVNLAKASAFYLAATLILKPDLAPLLRPYLRYTWMAVFILITIAAGDKIFDTATRIRERRELFEHKAAMKEEL